MPPHPAHNTCRQPLARARKEATAGPQTMPAPCLLTCTHARAGPCQARRPRAWGRGRGAARLAKLLQHERLGQHRRVAAVVARPPAAKVQVLALPVVGPQVHARVVDRAHGVLRHEVLPGVARPAAGVAKGRLAVAPVIKAVHACGARWVRRGRLSSCPPAACHACLHPRPNGVTAGPPSASLWQRSRHRRRVAPARRPARVGAPSELACMTVRGSDPALPYALTPCAVAVRAPTVSRWLPSSALTYGAISSIQASISVSQPIRSQRGSLIRSQDRIASSLLYVCGAQARPALAVQRAYRADVRGGG